MIVRNRFFRSASFSMVGNIVLAELLVAAPLLLLFTITFHFDGTLTLGWFFYMAFISAVAGAVLGLLVWFTVARPLIRRKQ